MKSSVVRWVSSGGEALRPGKATTSKRAMSNRANTSCFIVTPPRDLWLPASSLWGNPTPPDGAYSTGSPLQASAVPAKATQLIGHSIDHFPGGHKHSERQQPA